MMHLVEIVLMALFYGVVVAAFFAPTFLVIVLLVNLERWIKK